ncbi:MAG: hypothetical protein ACKVU1_11895 [bacterium]
MAKQATPHVERSAPLQVRHDRMVAILAREYAAKGYRVSAELEGFPAPEPIEGAVPDIRAEADGRIVVIEVETSDTLFGSEYEAEHKAFRKWKEHDPKTHDYKMVIA